MNTKRLRAVIFLAVCCLFGYRGVAQEENVLMVGNVTARMRYGDRIYNVFPMASNLKVPYEQWQFRYLPLVIPEADGTGALVIDGPQIGDAWGASVRLWFDNSLARAEGFRAVRAGYPTEAPRFQEANVGSVPIWDVKFTVTHPKGKFVSEPFNPGGALAWPVMIPAATKADAEAIMAWLRTPLSEIKCEYKYGTRSLKENSRTVTMKHLRNTRVQKKLDGLPKDNGMVYVHRDSFSQLAERVQSQFEGIDWVEDPITFDASIVDGLVALWNKQIEVDLSKWSEFKQSSVFNPEDLSPDRITRDFQKSFTYDAGTKQYKLNVGGEAGASVGIGPITIGGSAKGSYSKDELESFLRKHSLEVELDGMKIVPKKIWLQVVNTADFAREDVISNRRLFVGGKEVQTELVDVRPEQAIRDRAVQKDLAGRIADLDRLLADLKASSLKIERQTLTILGSPAVKDPGPGGPGRQVFHCQVPADRISIVEEFPIRVDFTGKPVAGWHVPLWGQSELSKFSSYFHVNIDEKDRITFNVATPSNPDASVVVFVYILYREP
jgi:hypothetical protein